MPFEGLETIIQLLQSTSEQDEDKQLVTYDELELSDESIAMAREFLQSLAAAATGQSSTNPAIAGEGASKLQQES